MSLFLHGNPVPPDRFIGRRRERERLLNFIAHNGESVAVIGEPRVGKTSLLAYLASPACRADAQNRSAKRLLFLEADAHLVGDDFDPARFWAYVFGALEASRFFDEAEPSIAYAYRSCRSAGYPTTAFEHLLKSLGSGGYRLVLFIDEVDYLAEQSLRHHPAFFAALRSLLKTSVLTLVAASRTPLARLNVMAKAGSGSGSPCFNTLREVILGAMTPEDVTEILRAGGSALSSSDETFVREASGGYPYLVQVAADALVEAYEDGAGAGARREAASVLLRTTDDSLREIWSHWLPVARYVFAAVAVTHLEALGEAAGWRSPDGSAASALRADTVMFQQELNALKKHGFVAATGDRVQALAFLVWFSVKLRQKSQSAAFWDTWIREEGWDGVLSPLRWQTWNTAICPRAITLDTDLESLVLAHLAPAALPAVAPLPPPAMTVLATPAPIDVFVSYSHRDEALRAELATHLDILRRTGVIRPWHDRQIGAGEDWKGAIHSRLEAAQVILLLVSADFLASDYCYDLEMKRAIERRSAGKAHVIPVILRACDWSGAPFSGIQSLPTDARPVTSWPNRDEAWDSVARGIRAAASKLTDR